MRDRSKTSAVETIEGRTVDDWDKDWIEIQGGFLVDHPTLYNIVGLYRADLAGQPQVIGVGTEHANGGLFKRLQTLQSEIIQIGNNYKTANFIRDNAAKLTLHVLSIGKGPGLAKTARDLLELFRSKYNLEEGEIGPR